MNKIVIIGAGHVGTHVANMLITKNICSELVLIDKDIDKAVAHAWDLADTMAYQACSCKVYAGSYEDVSDADLIIFSACGSYFNENRLEELDESMEVVDDVAPKIEASGFHGIVISITNPCDLVAYYLQSKISATVIGSGTMLDSGRFRDYIAEELDVNVKSVSAYIMGEHGDSQVPIWSRVMIGHMGLKEALNILGRETSFPYEDIEHKTIYAGGHIANGKGCTEFGIGVAACELAQAILLDERRVLSCSSMLKGEYGEDGVFASMPCLIGKHGVIQTLPIDISEQEKERFKQSCKLMKSYITNKM